ncbi:MAG: hypothetical protein IH626_02335 [Rhodospirillales bacterium]|nr:hypothetical protein [Rhodospirillales bacterium]
MALFLLVLEEWCPPSPSKSVAVPAPSNAESEVVDRSSELRKPVSLIVVSLPAPPIASEPAEIKPLPVRAAPSAAETPVPQPMTSAVEAPRHEIKVLRPGSAESQPPAQARSAVREVVPLQPAREAIDDSSAVEAQPVKALMPALAVRREEPAPPAPASQRTENVEPLRSHLAEALDLARPAEAEAPRAADLGTVHVSTQAGGAVAQEGRALLRLLEHGSGPAIAIAWPSDTGQQTRLYQVLARCYGMRSIVMDGQGILYVADGARGHRWELNLDRFSGFVRQPLGFIAPEERAQAAAIRRHHTLDGSAGVVRIFPRRVDAVLLGGLRQVLGDSYGDARAIHAVYRLEGSRLFVEHIERDGVVVDGRIAFASLSRGACGG